MKIVLLPGLDGTGELFAPLLSYLCTDTLVIKLPTGGKQDYQTLARFVMRQLPTEEFVLLAESFSGPIAALITQTPPPTLRGVIFVATFLSPPRRGLLRVAKQLPLKPLSRVPLSAVLIRWLLLGWACSDGLLAQFRSIVERLPEAALQGRIGAIGELRLAEFSSPIPAFYIQASRDRLIPENKWREFPSRYSDFSRSTVDAPHFILQTRPDECAALINRFVVRCSTTA